MILKRDPRWYLIAGAICGPMGVALGKGWIPVWAGVPLVAFLVFMAILDWSGGPDR